MGEGDALAAGILFAAVAKSAQLPFSPWIFRAMQGPSSVSALLHSSTMVAAGAWLLVRLHEPLGIVAWFAPAAIAIGLATAWVAGVVAFMQHDAKRVLAASTSAQFGLAFAAVGAGSAGAALVHLGNHAVFKALLFLAAGIAITAAGTERLSSMRLGRALPATAAASLLGVLALAGVPPLGAAWSKEGVVAAAGESSRALAVLLLGAGALSAAYAARFQVLAFGRADAPRRASSRPEIIAVLAVATLAVVVAASSVLSWPSVEHAVESFTELAVPEPRLWETVVSLATIGLAAGIGVAFARVELRRSAATEGSAHDWLGLAAATEHVVVAPIRAASRVCAALEARLRSASVRGVVALSRWLPRAMRNILSWQQAIPGGVVALSRWLPRTMRKFLSWRQAVAAARRVSKASVTRAEPAIDASGRGVAWAIDTAGEGIRRGHPGAVPLHYAFVIGGFAVLAIGTWIWSWR